jgi:hypothetical protein
VHLDDTAAEKTFVLKCFFLDTFEKGKRPLQRLYCHAAK